MFCIHHHQGLSLIRSYSNRIRARRLCCHIKPLYSMLSLIPYLLPACNGTCRTASKSIQSTTRCQIARTDPFPGPFSAIRGSSWHGSSSHPCTYRRGSLPQARLNSVSSQPHNKVRPINDSLQDNEEPCLDYCSRSIYSFIHPISWSKAI